MRADSTERSPRGAEGWPVGRCGTLHLDKDGGLARMEEYTEWSKYYFNGFLLALGYYNFFEEAA